MSRKIPPSDFDPDPLRFLKFYFQNEDPGLKVSLFVSKLS